MRPLPARRAQAVLEFQFRLWSLGQWTRLLKLSLAYRVLLGARRETKKPQIQVDTIELNQPTIRPWSYFEVKIICFYKLLAELFA
jgi:hypothetical protein